LIISLSNKFIHVANLKVASTAIEKSLRPFAEIALVEARYGKHQSVQQFQDRFGWLFSETPISEFFIFGVIRNPVSYMTSLYNSHCDPKFKERTSLYTGDMRFDQFLTEWTEANPDMVRPQFERFLGHHRLLGMNFISTYENLTSNLGIIADKTGVSGLREIGPENVSPNCLKPVDLARRHVDWINTRFRPDFDFINCYADKMLPQFHFKLD
jgi:Sulfotransferase family